MTEKVGAEYVKSILDRYGFEKIHRTRSGYTALCKFHDNKRTPAFSISDTGLWHCFSCDAKGNLKKLIQALGGELDWQEELKILGLQLNADKFGIDRTRRKIGPLPRDFKEYSKDNMPPKYLLTRLTWHSIRGFRLGSSNMGRMAGRILIPIFFKGKMVGVHGRAIDPALEPKYYNAGFDIHDYVFNYDGCDRSKPVIVVEGAFNVMSMREKGLPNAVATFGTKFSAKQVQLILSLAGDSVVICFDRDSPRVVPGQTTSVRPGQKAAVALAEAIYQFIPTYIMPLPIDKDPNDLPAETLKACYERRVAYEKIRG